MKTVPYAVIESGGKQYKVEPGDWIKVEKLDSEEGSLVELSNVLVVSQNDKTIIGNPSIEGARVTATIASHGKDKKTIIFKFKSKNRYRRKQGHRQSYTQLNIQEILTRTKETPTGTKSARTTKPKTKSTPKKES